MSRFRLQFTLKVLMVLALASGILLGLWGTHVKIRCERERAEIEEIKRQFKEYEDFWNSEQPNQLTPPRTDGGIIGP